MGISAMTSIHLLAPANYRRMPWKNGGGHTLEIAACPAEVNKANFDWRVSVAEVAGDGPFSEFAGVDRTLVLLEGNGMRLAGTGAALELHAPFDMVAFAGEAALHCELVAGPTRDFNLMVRRATAAGTVVVVQGGAARLLTAATCVCFVAQGTVECCAAGDAPVVIPAAHTLVVAADAPHASVTMRVHPRSPSAVAVVALITAPSSRRRQ
jgi:environmental stress-induced protein Ves